MLKSIALILSMLPACTLFSQRTQSKTVAAEQSAPALLSQKLVASCTTEREKVKAIFHWITDNIAYYKKETSGGWNKNRKSQSSFEDEEDDKALPSLTDRVATKVLKERQAVCEGYARLFKSLCDHAGIRAAIVTGYARTNNNKAKSKFHSNHTWNAVFLDSTWQLLDPTWASGYITRSSGEFVRAYDSYYFLTPPEQYILDHYPDEANWSLLNEQPVIGEFRYTPFRQRSFMKYSITSFYPAEGIIEASVGDTIRLQLQTSSALRNLNIAPDTTWDVSSLPVTPDYAYVRANDLKGNKVEYSYPVESDKTQWLLVMYNDDAVLRYRLNIRKPTENGTVVK